MWDLFMLVPDHGLPFYFSYYLDYVFIHIKSYSVKILQVDSSVRKRAEIIFD